jgi:MFS family permease
VAAFRGSRDFRVFWASTALAFIAAQIQILVMAWLVYDITASAYLLSIYTAAGLVPMLLGPFIGFLSERFDRVKLLIGTQTLFVTVNFAVAILVVTGLVQFWHLVIAGFLAGITQFPMMPARNTLVMDMVPREQLPNAVALTLIAMLGSQSIAPLLGGFLLDSLGVWPSLSFAAIGGALGLVCLLLVKMKDTRSKTAGGSPIREIVEGFAIAFKNRPILLVLAITVLANVCVFACFMTFMPVFAKDVLKVGPDGLGALQAVFGLGSLVGAFAIASLGDFRHKGQLYLWGTAGAGLFFGLFALSKIFVLSLGLLFMTGLISSGFAVMQSTLILLLSPPEARGRIMGVLMVAIGSQPFAAYALGMAAEGIGVPTASAIVAFGLVASMVAIFFMAPSIRKMR